MRFPVPALLLLLLGMGDAHAQVADRIRHCIAKDGTTIYTDRACAFFDALDHKPEPPRDTPSDDAPPNTAKPATPADATLDALPAGPVRSDCVRRTDTLLFDLRRAIESQDVNQLAGLYHWPGVSGRGARAIMDRLDRIAARPRASADLIYPAVAPVHENPAAFPPGTPPEDPIGVRVMQSQPAAPAPDFEERLLLVRHAGCWWLRF